MKEKFNYEEFEKASIERLKKGDALLGKEGILTPLLKQFLEKAMEGEIDHHLDGEERQSGNRRNGKSKKKVKTSSGQFELETPRDRKNSFSPQIVKKREVFLGEDLENKIIRLYARGMSYEDIKSHLSEIYDLDISQGKISGVTDKVLPELEAWRNRPLDALYTIVYLDAVHFKVREDGRVKTKALYNVMGIKTDGHKELLGLYIGESEGAKFWLSVLTDLQDRGVEDILIACIDNLSGFSEAVESIFPRARVQLCIVHQVRNSLRYVVHDDQKAIVKDLKAVYQATNLEQAESHLLGLEETWGEKYPVVVRSWTKNWDRLSTYFDFPRVIRKAIYTNNPIESYHRQVRKHTKNKGVFPSDRAVLKLVYLVSKNIMAKWTMPMQKWALVVQQLAIIFEDRLTDHLRL
jgi:transposase-like protein